MLKEENKYKTTISFDLESYYFLYQIALHMLNEGTLFLSLNKVLVHVFEEFRKKYDKQNIETLEIKYINDNEKVMFVIFEKESKEFIENVINDIVTIKKYKNKIRINRFLKSIIIDYYNNLKK